jgi:hypothetical protein
MAVLQRLQTAACQLKGNAKGKTMSQADLKNEIDTAPVEPLLPIEKKLIGWSLGLGIGLLIVLIAINHFFPIRI